MSDNGLVTLVYLLTQIPPKIVGGDEYAGTECFGDDCRYLDFESNVECVFNSKTGEILELLIQDPNSPIIWRKSALESDYITQVTEMLDLEEDEIEVRRANVDSIEEMIKEVNRHYVI